MQAAPSAKLTAVAASENFRFMAQPPCRARMTKSVCLDWRPGLEPRYNQSRRVMSTSCHYRLVRDRSASVFRRIGEECADHRRRIELPGELLVHVQQYHFEIVMDGREVAAAQLFVDRHQLEIGGCQRLGDIDHALDRMQPNEIKPMRELHTRRTPSIIIELRRH